MQIKHSAMASVIVAAVALTSAAAKTTQQEQPAAGQAPGYAWAEACKSCHADIYDTWSKTKHARTLDRLSSDEQQQTCITCHTTGGVGKLEVDGNVVNKGVQCEGCHGPAAAHVADEKNKVGLTKTPSARVCEGCHNDKSPHYRGFIFQGMSKLVHAIPKK